MTDGFIRPPKKPVVNPTKGTEILDQMLLQQYTDKPLLREYMLAFIEEMDTLLEQIEEVYLGRFIAFAKGKQLDIIGVILGQSRAVNLPIAFFGFQDEIIGAPPGVDGFADQSDPSDGGVFRSEDQTQGYTTVPLSDEVYRRLLYARAALSVYETIGVEEIYILIRILINKSPRFMELNRIANRRLELTVSKLDVTQTSGALIEYFSHFMIPVGTTLTVTRV